MENLSIIFINLIVLGVFAAVLFARAEVEKNLIHRQRISTDILGNKIEKLVERVLLQDKNINELKSQIEAMEKRAANAAAAAKLKAEKDQVDPLNSFVKAGQESQNK